MGNCLTCIKSEPPPSSAADPACTMPLQDSFQNKEMDRNVATWSGSQQLNQQIPSRSQQQLAQQALMETKVYETAQSNGNGSFFITSSGSSLRNSFYTRLPGCGDKRGNASKNTVIETNIVALFEQYKDSAEDCILDDGIEKLCSDLAVRPDEFCVLVLAWKFDAKQMCCFTRDEFLLGCKSLKADSIRSIQCRLPELCNQVKQDTELFKDLYRFTFRFGLEVGQRILPSDMAICLWRLVFSQNVPPLLDKWLYFLEKHSQVRGIPRDTWNMFLNFVEAVGNDLSTYDDTEAWPSLFDDFVEFENDQMNQNISKIT